MGKMNNEVERKMFILLVADEKIKKQTNQKARLFFWRRRRDSNPRTAFDGYTISNRARSTGLRDFSIVCAVEKTYHIKLNPKRL